MTCSTNRHRVEVHDLKSWPEYWKAIANGTKTAELRQNDRNYHEGDILVLREWLPAPNSEKGISPAWGGEYTGKVVLAEVKHILIGSGVLPLALPEGWVVMSIEVMHVDFRVSL